MCVFDYVLLQDAMYIGPSTLLMMLRSMFVCFLGLFLISTFTSSFFFNNQGAWLVSKIKIWTCGWDVGPLKLKPFLHLLTFKGELLKDDLSLWQQKCTLMQKLCSAQVQNADQLWIYRVFQGQLADRKPGMCCKCWTKAGSGGGGRQIINYSAPPDKDNHLVSAGQAEKISCLMGSTALVGI